MIPNFHDTSVLDVLMMFVWSLPAIIGAIAALMAAKGTAQNKTALGEVHKLVNSNLASVTTERDALQEEVVTLKDTARRESAKS